VGRRYQQLDVGRFAERVDAWLISWPPGSGLPMHDHDGSGAVVHLVRSALRERYVVNGLIVERALVAGDRVHLPPEHLHEITNVAGEEALSLHVYSPRLTMVRFCSEFGELIAAPSTRPPAIEPDFAS
jgi:predicted metal-dependent enzyme (double-stranded beta helix superfamily)